MNATEGVSRETSERLDRYVDLLRHWNTRIRLTGLDLSAKPGPIEDSLQLWRLAPPTVSAALDIGSGNGIPALPLAIAFAAPFTLVESDHRKAAFLREVARQLACPVTVAAQRMEDMPEQPYDLITARAFAPLARLLPLVYRRQASHTVCLFPKGAKASQEVDEARREWSFDCIAHPSPTGCVLQVTDVRPLH